MAISDCHLSHENYRFPDNLPRCQAPGAESAFSHTVTWHPEELFFHFPSLFARQIPQLVRHIVWEMRQHMTETGRISGICALEEERDTRIRSAIFCQKRFVRSRPSSSSLPPLRRLPTCPSGRVPSSKTSALARAATVGSHAEAVHRHGWSAPTSPPPGLRRSQSLNRRGP